MYETDADLWAWVDRQPDFHRALVPPPFGRRVVQGLCGWELVALATGLVPSITALVQPHQRRWAVRAAVVVPLLTIAHHLLIESPTTKEEKP